MASAFGYFAWSALLFSESKHVGTGGPQINHQSINKKMNIISKIIMAVLAPSIPIQAQVSEKREIASFSSISVSSGIVLTYEESQEFSVMAEAADGKSVTAIITELKGALLEVYAAPQDNPSLGGLLKVHVTGNGVSSFIAASKSRLLLKNPIKSDTVHITASGGASFVGMVQPNDRAVVRVRSGATVCARLATQSLVGDVSGATAVLSGTAKNVRILANSRASCSAKNLASQNAHITAEGRSIVTLHGKCRITASAEEGSSISYFGKPTKVNLSPGSYPVPKKKG